MPDKKGQNLADLIYGQDSIRPTEVKRPAALGLGQALQRGHEFVSKPFGYPNPPAEAISEFLGVPAIARTLERLGYGEPLTTGRGMTTKPKEDTAEALLSVAPLVPATKGMPVGAMFIGPKAKTWNKTAAELAVKMEQAGADPVDIWRQTGTFRGADGILRQEISDVGALHRGEKELKELSKEKKAQAQTLRSSIAGVPGQKDLFPKALTEARRPAREEVKRLTEEAAALERNPTYTGHSAKFALEHPELYAAYPELANVKILQGGYGGPGTRASLSAIPGAMEVDLYDLGLKSNPRSSLLHEMQHAVQTLEGMGPGGNPALAFKDPKAFEILQELRKKASIPMTFEEYAKHLSHIPEEKLQSAYEKYVKDIPNAVKAIDNDLQHQAATEYYKRLSGEAEARATQAREPMGPTQRRQEFPYSSYDVLPEDLIVKPPKGSTLSMEADLTAAEKEANLAKFREASKVPQRLYHGTTATEGGKGQEAIRRIKPSKEGSLGSGVYLTPSAAHSSTYSGSPNEEAIQMLLADKHSADIGRQFLQNQQAGNVLPGQIGGNMLPVYAQVKNPLILEGKGDPMVEALVKLGMDEDKAARMVERAYENKGYIGKEVETRARAAGYDGLMQYRNGDLSEVVVYNPNAVKSAIGNQGTYDITKPGLSEAKGGAIHMDKGGAAFGVFPQMKPRRSRQDPEAAKQVPVDLARGFAAGALGMPGDVESLIRLLPGLSEETILPTSEDILKRIPGGSDTPASRAASGLGILGGGFYTGPGSAARAVSSVAGALPKAARDFVQAAGQPAVNVIKPKGGNWLTGSVEKALENLKPRVTTERLAQYTPEQAEQQVASGRVARNDALANWIDRNLTNYIKKEMATPDDPVRKLAEQGITHLPENTPTSRYMEDVWENREKAGFPKSYGTSREAQVWESLADSAIKSKQLGETIRKNNPGGMTMRDLIVSELGGEWAAKAPDTALIHELRLPGTSSLQQIKQELGFDHIIDVLREDLATGRIRPEQLNKVSMEQAVRRTYEYDQELAKKMAEATAAARADLPVYKEYPEKYRWIELNRPGAFASESEAMGHSVRGYEPPKGHPDWSPASGDSGSPSYGHGGWEAIKSGKAKVYSLVDEKGQPHVTVEVERKPMTWDSVTEEIGTREAEKLWKEFDELGGYYQDNADEAFDKFISSKGITSPARITQIKGKQNAAPKEEYLPFVQDFVRSGQWSDVGDLRNTGLEDIANYKEPVRAAAEEVYPGQRFLTLEQIQPLVNAASEKKMESGGSVHISNNPDTMRLELAGGGGVDRLTPQDMLYLTSHPDFAKMTAQQQREAVVNMGDRELSERMKGKMAGGGTISKLAKLLRAPAKTRQEIEEIAERMAPQVTGEYVREKPKSAKTVAGKTAKQFEREKNLPVDIRATDVERVPEKVDVEKLKDQVAIGIAGDPTVTGKTLYGVGETRLASPAPQHGGPLYGLYNDEGQFWASGLGAARKVQNLARQASQQYDAPVLGNYVMMGSDSINYAQHFADANLQAIDLSKMTAKQVEGFNDLLRQGSPKSGPRPSFPGIEDKGSAYLHLAFDPELRKYFNQLMQQPTVTEKFGLPSGQDIRFAITEPELQNLERGVTGFSLGRMNPEVKAKALKLSEHPTYSHDIPGEFIGQTKYPIPYELSFPDTLKAIRENPKQAPHEFGSLKMVGPRQIIDQQLIDEIKAYEERMKALTGKKKGGAIKKAPGGEVTVPDMTDGGKVIDGGPFKKGGKVQFTDNLDTMRLAVGRK